MNVVTIMKKILVIIGPTAIGKTKIAIEIAKKISGEIISADSRQIYQYLTIGTAKPIPSEQRLIQFHLIDFVHPDHVYSCGQFSRDAEVKIEEVKKRNKYPIVCGGTGLYIKALFHPLHVLPQSDKKVKQKFTKMLKQHGIEYLYHKLRTIDPAWAGKIMPQDKQRILRGLEVFEITGKPLSSLTYKEKRKAQFKPYYVGLNVPRDILYQKIDKRVDEMIEKGLVKEVTSLLKRNFDPQSNALRTIGYKEIIAYLQKNLTLAEAIQKIKQRTRNFAKRQITWFKKIPDVQWYNPEDINIVETIIDRFESKRGHQSS
jgi:tRNA dimethylallyltransferase